MSTELSKYERDGNRVDLPLLLDMGKEFQEDTGWQPTQAKNVGAPREAEKVREEASD